MAEADSFSEEECCNVYWKIKNFSFCNKQIDSPKFNLYGNRYWLMINLESADVTCTLKGFGSNKINIRREISLLTCDGSTGESISGGQYVYLEVSKDVIFRQRRRSFLPEDTLTVRFRFQTDSERGELLMCSKIGVKRKCFLWTVKGFSNCGLNTAKYVEKSEDYGDMKMTLKSTDGVNTDEKFYIEISRTGGEKCYCILKVSVLDVDGKSVNEISAEFVFQNKDDQPTTFPVFFRKSEFLKCSNLLLPEDTLSLKCNLSMSLGSFVDQTDLISYYENVKPFMKESEVPVMSFNKGKNDSGFVTDLQTDLKRSFEDETLFDVCLQVDSEVIRANKFVLSARSSVFKAMFTKDMQETNSSTVVIEDSDAETVRKFLLYMYTDSLNDEEWGNARKLYLVADKFQVMGLKRKCACIIITKLSIWNAGEALLLANLHQDADLTTAVIDFITENSSAVFDTVVWKELEESHSSLVIPVLREICRFKQFK